MFGKKKVEDSLKIDGKELPFKFSLNSARLYCKARGIELWQYEEDIAKVDFEKTTLETLDILGYLVLTAFQNVDENVDIKFNEVIDCLADEKFLSIVFKKFFDAHPSGGIEKKKKV